MAFKNKILFYIFPFFAGILLPACFAFASWTDGTIDSAEKYAWSNEAGWINFGATQGNVHITDTELTGYIWSENEGWINLDPPGSGVKNNGEGVLSGYAWGEQTGWINFSGVTISQIGYFGGTATGNASGTISFSCSKCAVRTDWRAQSVRVIPRNYSPDSGSSGGGGGVSLAGPFDFLINNGAFYTNSYDVSLSLVASSEISKMQISNSSDFSGSGIEDFQASKSWVLPAGDGQKTIYVKFYTARLFGSPEISKSIILDTVPPQINLTNKKDKYSTEEEVIFGGTSEPLSEIILYIDDALFGSLSADQKGEWLATLGKLSEGSHKIILTPIDLAKNKGGDIVFNFYIEKPGKKPVATPEISLPGVIKKIGELISPIFKKHVEIKKPEKIVTVPKTPPPALSEKWVLLPEKPIRAFVFDPLPKNIAVLTQEFPKLSKTFSEVGIKKMVDAPKIVSSNLILPTLTESVGIKGKEIAPGKFIAAKAVPLDALSLSAKQNMPNDIIFAKSGGGMIDYSIALSLSAQGQTQQTIKTLAGETMQLIVKPDKPVKKVKGYIIFKSKKVKPVSYEVLGRYLAASLLFENPEASEDNKITTEALVLGEFEYKDAGEGIYTADINAPIVDGEYEILTVIEYEDEQAFSKEIKIITVVDPEGYIFEKSGDKETRISGAVASLYWLNPDTKQYELWPAKDYQQENPQVTDVRGSYSFLVPEGFYYLKVDAPGYTGYDGKPFEVKEGSGVHINVEMKTAYWWIKVIGWKDMVLIFVVLLLIYNFYRDRVRSSKAVTTINQQQ